MMHQISGQSFYDNHGYPLIRRITVSADKLIAAIRSGHLIAAGTTTRDRRRRATLRRTAEKREARLRTLNGYYEELRNDPVRWKMELAERRLWERTLLDCLEPE